MDIVDKAIRNWKLHVLALVLTVIAELIGRRASSSAPAFSYWCRCFIRSRSARSAAYRS